MKNKIRLILLCSALITALGPSASFGGEPPTSIGQMIYVPVYSHIYGGDREDPFYLTATVSIRNIDTEFSLTISKVDYYSTDGKYLKGFLKEPLILQPLSSVRYVIKESDKSGGAGAKFIITWESKTPVLPVLVEAVMIGTSSMQGISFTSRGVVLKENGPH